MIVLFGSDTGIRTRVSAVRGRRPGPLDDIANENNEAQGEGTPRRTRFHFPMYGREGQAKGCDEGEW